MRLDQYISNLNQRYQLGNATEHTFRGDLQQLLEFLLPEIQATNEPKRQACGAPDYILTKKDIPIGFIEAKDIGDKDLKGEKKTGNKEQFDRYKASLNNLIFTDYLDFHFYQEGEFITSIAIGEVQGKAIKPLPDNFNTFTNLIKDFCLHVSQTITSPKKLAEMMAGKAKLMADVIEKALNSDEDTHEDSSLKDQMEAFRQILIHDISPKGFADVYAQTIAYGMFAARLHDPTLPTFSRQEASELIPKSNPFLRKLFGYIAGPDIDDRIKWIVDSLVDVFLACNVEEILQDYGKEFTSPSGGGREGADPIIHFYETFLSEYDPALRKARGVWYTPAPVVNFIVRAVDDILKTEFDLSQGLADSNKITPPSGAGGLHRVQILDPATGTGTFLAEVVKHIQQKFKGQEGIWNSYVENHLLPRLNGFELLMASYAMAHLQLDLLLTETGFKPTNNQRLRVFLTNSLEEYHKDTGTLFASWLSNEANEANRIKRDTPVMCVLGNPPYSVSSTNKGEWIEHLLQDYKKNLKERNIQPLSDDYIKFIRYGQHFIEKNGSGVLAYISNNSFIDGIIHRQMRKSLLESFDTIYILDLHGSTKKGETTAKGNRDENVFDIQQGVSINIFVKTGKKKSDELSEVLHIDLHGKRTVKYDFLKQHSLNQINWKTLKPQSPYYFFVEKDFKGSEEYGKGFGVQELFLENSVGIVTSKDAILINDSRDNLVKNIESFYDIKIDEGLIEDVDYRVFDKKYIYYETTLIDRARDKIMRHVLSPNISLVTPKQAIKGFKHVFISNTLCDKNYIDSAGQFGAGNVFPLYLYPQDEERQTGLFASKKEQKRTELHYALKQAKVHYKQIKKFFDTTVVPFFEKIEKPSNNEVKLFEENKTTYEEAKANIEQIEEQIKALDAPQTTKESSKIPRKPNLKKEIVEQIAQGLGLTFTPEKEESKDKAALVSTFAPIDILDYIYAVLHSPTYREKYKEFLKIDFPRVPYPTPPLPSPEEREKGLERFWALVKLGGELRQIHLLESPVVEQYITQYPIGGSNEVGKIHYSNQKVYINYEKTSPLGAGGLQYFEGVPMVAWEFYIGGYQPAQKWLKDRKGRTLDLADIAHYQKIIVALTETDRIMRVIDEVGQL